ncbi:BQ2448_1600 [Microbotryum intermedium]|uniref:BQ2448_1600 protein n=1 Tax=Microbotryum intermedium TaxID=269621 RepID=A0A238FGN1_9BASI|nr:BQ2448_1600 [Microbotryum intermedium]
MTTESAKTINTYKSDRKHSYSTKSGQEINGSEEGVYSVAPSPPVDQLSALNVLLRSTAAPGVEQRVENYTKSLEHVKEDQKHQSLPQKRRRSMLLAFVHFVWANVQTSIMTLFVSPTAIFGDPLSTIAILVIFPLDADSITKEDTAKAIQAARATLSGLPTTVPDVPAPGEIESRICAPKTTRIFDLDVAKACLAFSGLVYSRDEDQISQAIDRALDGNYEHAELHLKSSEATIRQQVQKWDLNYESVSNLGSPQGAFGSVFYTKVDAQRPFMVLVFKGTTPTNYSEFIVDCTLKRVDATSFFGGGTVHEGFATQLFSMFDEPGVSALDAYGPMTHQLKRIAKQLRENHPNSKMVPLWVTGHSLGAALAALFYARALRAPVDLGDHLELRDCYTFGGPRVGDALFAAHFESEAIKELNRPNTLWRVQNRSDMVCRVPPSTSFGGGLRRSVLSTSTSILNYSHIGIPFKLHPEMEPEFYEVLTEPFHRLTRAIVVQEGGQGAREDAREVCESSNPGWFGWLFAHLTPRFIFDHRVDSYKAHLNRIKVHGQGGLRRGTAPEAKTRGAEVHHSLN